MDFTLSPAQEAFRDEVRAWLDARKADGSIAPLSNASLDEYVEAGKVWQRKLYESGYCGLHWPAEYGGRGIGLI